MTSVNERKITEPGGSNPVQGRVRGLTITVIVLAVALIGLGARTVYDLASTPENAITPEVQAALDDYVAAWNQYHADAYKGLITDGYEFGSFGDESWGEVSDLLA